MGLAFDDDLFIAIRIRHDSNSDLHTFFILQTNWSLRSLGNSSLKKSLARWVSSRARCLCFSGILSLAFEAAALALFFACSLASWGSSRGSAISLRPIAASALALACSLARVGSWRGSAILVPSLLSISVWEQKSGRSLTNSSLVSLGSSSSLTSFFQLGCSLAETVAVQIDILIDIGGDGLAGRSDFCLLRGILFSLSESLLESSTESGLRNVNIALELGDGSVGLWCTDQ